MAVDFALGFISGASSISKKEEEIVKEEEDS
jgi:hypothetical protein